MEEEQELEVRSLSGESITISVSTTETIAALKLVLKHRFSPASSSSDFHLFLRGMKLGVQSQIGSHSINPGEFIALMPFTKKEKSRNVQCEGSGVALQTTQQGAPSSLAESAWRDMMEDLSYLSNTVSSEEQSGCLPNSSSDKSKDEASDKKHTKNYSRKRRRKVESKAGLAEDLISSLLLSSKNSVLDEDVCGKFLQVLESVHCLSDAETGNCMLLSKVDMQENGQPYQPSCSCLCPPWLTIMMKTFTFLNIFAGFLQVHHESVMMTFDLVNDSLDKLRELGFCASVEDLKRLPDLCPKVVYFIDQEAESKLSLDAIVINFSREKTDQVKSNVKAQKRAPASKIISSIKRRQILFQTTLEGGLRLLLCDKIDKKVVSLAELITSIKKTDLSSHGVAQGKYGSTTEAQCCENHPLSPTSMLEHLRKGIGSKGQIVHVEEINARVADFTEIPDELSENAKSSLKAMGITKLYSHQAESIRASLCGRNVVVATMTSSGKSLCYNLPVLEALSQNDLACALYLFPTKALAQDQLRALLSMTENFEHFDIGVYDGDTSQEERIWLRDNARLLITNPDMLHLSILPFHGQFQRILSNLKFVVFDEAHAYKGAFGCHTSLILRRLRRLCSHVYGSDPSFVFSTATSANPRQHAMELANLPTMELIDKDGSPAAPKLFALWNPPLCTKTAGRKNNTIVTKRSSPILEVSRLLAEMVQHGLRSIAFCKTRKLCELVLSYTHEVLQDTAPHLVNSICAYRAGYIAEDRRRIESEFFSGKLRGIAATSALELGIDVGHVDVTLHLGFPGSIASLWQQAGRSGRRGKPSLAVYVAFEGPLDQYFMKFPLKLFRSRMECCHVDAQNPKILEQHLICAATEHPLSLVYDGKYFGSGLSAAVTALKNRGYLSTDPSRESAARIWSYIGQEKSPSRSISIRAMESEKYKVADGKTNEVLEEIEESRAFFQVYEGAIYMNQGKTYIVKELNLSSKIAVCQRADVKYYTQTRDYTDIDVIGGDLAYPPRVLKMQFRGTTALTNSCRVTTTWFGFRRICKRTNRVLDTVDLVLPRYSYESQAVWIRVPTSVKSAVENKGFSFRAGLHAASHAVLNVVPLYIICDSSDLAPECANPHETRYAPERILLYDQRPGGTGISMRIQPVFDDMLTSALDMLTSCYCSADAGCPNCVQTLACQEYNELLHKDAAIMIIKGVLEAEDLYSQQHPGRSGTA
ncbi:hypothetical protein BVRB_5g113540 isoform A [Beta vulgaris subsp. vulgaris]|uniref:Uncharacterized protein n=1 Tax=Beta vulgaris subsp. vulgaris TaxID=3555 RepID=A0A0J8CFR3_BETVV|nr:uncharacterized protein LOC104893932 isoform X2 [Beta vulgaris subsp. vulgaris]KMT10853.1 hypothetical protein BVRB_5g113540 isoform A [Beta vulgaris subsp. vulgaris]